MPSLLSYKSTSTAEVNKSKEEFFEYQLLEQDDIPARTTLTVVGETWHYRMDRILLVFVEAQANAQITRINGDWPK